MLPRKLLGTTAALGLLLLSLNSRAQTPTHYLPTEPQKPAPHAKRTLTIPRTPSQWRSMKVPSTT